MATIAINGMSFYAHHGCFDQERMIGTHFRVDLVFSTDTSLAEQTDSIDHTVSYLDVYQVVSREMNQPSHLLEHVARRICDAVLAASPAIETIGVKVHKLAPPLGGQMDSVSVELTAHR